MTRTLSAGPAPGCARLEASALARRLRCGAIALMLALLSACTSSPPEPEYGPPPGSDQRARLQAIMEQILGEHYELDGAPRHRFAVPVADRVARWHFAPEPPPGQSHELGWVDGWCLEFWVTPRYAGFPSQPESHRMAFFVDGELRGIFSASGDRAPLELDKWSPCWVDTEWQVDARTATPTAHASEPEGER